MAGSSKDIIDSLIAKFHAMSDLCKARDASFAK